MAQTRRSGGLSGHGPGHGIVRGSARSAITAAPASSLCSQRRTPPSLWAAFVSARGFKAKETRLDGGRVRRRKRERPARADVRSRVGRPIGQVGRGLHGVSDGEFTVPCDGGAVVARAHKPQRGRQGGRQFAFAVEDCGLVERVRGRDSAAVVVRAQPAVRPDGEIVERRRAAGEVGEVFDGADGFPATEDAHAYEVLGAADALLPEIPDDVVCVIVGGFAKRVVFADGRNAGKAVRAVGVLPVHSGIGGVGQRNGVRVGCERQAGIGVIGHVDAVMPVHDQERIKLPAGAGRKGLFRVPGCAAVGARAEFDVPVRAGEIGTGRGVTPRHGEDLAAGAGEIRAGKGGMETIVLAEHDRSVEICRARRALGIPDLGGVGGGFRIAGVPDDVEAVGAVGGDLLEGDVFSAVGDLRVSRERVARRIQARVVDGRAGSPGAMQPIVGVGDDAGQAGGRRGGLGIEWEGRGPVRAVVICPGEFEARHAVGGFLEDDVGAARGQDRHVVGHAAGADRVGGNLGQGEFTGPFRGHRCGKREAGGEDRHHRSHRTNRRFHARHRRQTRTGGYDAPRGAGQNQLGGTSSAATSPEQTVKERRRTPFSHLTIRAEFSQTQAAAWLGRGVRTPRSRARARMRT